MPEVVGHVDGRHRPLVTILIPGQDDAVLALIDTGFNGYVLMHEDVAERLGFAKTGVTTNAEFADQGRHEVYVADGRIDWFGELLDIDVLVTADPPPRAARPDEPIALLGTSLLSPHILTVDFGRGRVVISQSDD